MGSPETGMGRASLAVGCFRRFTRQTQVLVCLTFFLCTRVFRCDLFYLATGAIVVRQAYIVASVKRLQEGVVRSVLDSGRTGGDLALLRPR